MISRLLPYIRFNEKGILVHSSCFIPCEEIISVKYSSPFGLEHILVIRSVGYRVMVPLYLNSEEIFEQVKIHAPLDNPFRIELLKHRVPKDGLRRYLIFVLIIILFLIFATYMVLQGTT